MQQAVVRSFTIGRGRFSQKCFHHLIRGSWLVIAESEWFLVQDSGRRSSRRSRAGRVVACNGPMKCICRMREKLKFSDSFFRANPKNPPLITQIEALASLGLEPALGVASLALARTAAVVREHHLEGLGTVAGRRRPRWSDIQ
jgi:hypothetical protein